MAQPLPHYDETHEAVCDSVRTFVAREIMPHVDVWERAGELPRELHKKAAEAGVLGLGYPEEYGGSGTLEQRGFDIAAFSEAHVSEKVKM